MGRRNRAAVSALVAAMMLMGTAAVAQDHSHDVVVHNGTGFRFPPSVDGFNRVSMQFFNEAATDISVAYASLTPGSPVTVTVYVTPAPSVDLTGSNAATEAAQAKACGDQFNALDTRFKKLHPDARQLVLGDVRAPSPAFQGVGRQVVYDYEDMFYGQKQTLRSETDLYCYVNGDWSVAYRTVAPVSVDYAPKLAVFLQGLKWPQIGAGRR